MPQQPRPRHRNAAATWWTPWSIYEGRTVYIISCILNNRRRNLRRVSLQAPTRARLLLAREASPRARHAHSRAPASAVSTLVTEVSDSPPGNRLAVLTSCGAAQLNTRAPPCTIKVDGRRASVGARDAARLHRWSGDCRSRDCAGAPRLIAASDDDGRGPGSSHCTHTSVRPRAACRVHAAVHP